MEGTTGNKPPLARPTCADARPARPSVASLTITIAVVLLGASGCRKVVDGPHRVKHLGVLAGSSKVGGHAGSEA